MGVASDIERDMGLEMCDRVDWDYFMKEKVPADEETSTHQEAETGKL